MSASSLVAALAPGVLAMLLSAGAWEQQEKPAENLHARPAPAKKNAAADDLESLVLSLGLDSHREESSAEHPTREDIEAYQRAAIGSWLDAQLRIVDDSITPAPAILQSFLERRQPTLLRVAGLLERDVPRWDSDPRAEPRDMSGLSLAPRLARILTAAALVEERAGHHVEAGNFLEASWSLSRSFSGQPDLMSQLIAVALGKLQAGALRKMSEPAVPWLDRMSGVEPWREMLEAVEAEPFASVRAGEAARDDQKARARAWRAVTDRLRELSPCEVAKLSSEEIWKPAAEEIARSIEAGADPSLKSLSDMATPSITGAIRRAGRLLVDRELTARVLELRLEKAASRQGRWPEKFFDTDSRVCPGSNYAYQTRGAAMSIRFAGSIDEPATAGAVSLPLVFEVRPPVPTRTPTRSLRPTTTPAPRP